MLSPIRIGKFTSSSIHKLMKNGRGGKPSVVTQSYIKEVQMEQRLGRPLNADLSARPTVWGHICEQFVSKQIDEFEYHYCSDETLQHPEIGSWVGTPDFICSDRVVDAKCPYTLKGFCELADIAITEDLETFKNDKPEYYWQLVSNAILTTKDKAELLVFCPYLSQLKSIRELCEDVDGDQNKLAWIYFSTDDDLPYLLESGYYQNMYKFVFEISAEDKQLLTEAVVAASKEL